MDASDLTRAKRDRVLYNAKGATSQQPSNKTLQTDSQTLINIARGPRQTVVNNVVVLPACSCVQAGGGGGGGTYLISLASPECTTGCTIPGAPFPAGIDTILVTGAQMNGTITILIGGSPVAMVDIFESTPASIPVTPLAYPTTITFGFI